MLLAEVEAARPVITTNPPVTFWLNRIDRSVLEFLLRVRRLFCQ